MQGYHTRIPKVVRHDSLEAFLASHKATIVALDPYATSTSLTAEPLPTGRLTLLFGGERGFDDVERNQLHLAGAAFRHLGPGILRTGTAVIAAVSITKAVTGALGDNRTAIIDGHQAR